MVGKKDERPSSDDMIRRAREGLGSDPSDPTTAEGEETSTPAEADVATDDLDIDEYIESLRSQGTGSGVKDEPGEEPSNQLPEPDVDSHDIVAEPDRPARTIPIRHDTEPMPDMEPEIPQELPGRSRPIFRRTWLRQLAWILAVGFIIFNRCGVADNLFGDPAGEQLLTAFEEEFKSAGLSDGTWNCIESNMREGGYVDDLNEVNISEVEAALESPRNLPPPELRQFIAGLQIQLNPNQATSCMSSEEAASLNLPGP